MRSHLQVNKPPYDVSNGNTRLPLGHNTAAMSVMHHDGTLQYDSHNIYGLQVCSQSPHKSPMLRDLPLWRLVSMSV